MRKTAKKESDDEAAATAKEDKIGALYAICRRSMQRLCRDWPTKFKEDDFPELERHEFFFFSPDKYPMDSLDGQIEYWECRIQELEQIEHKLLEETNPFTHPNDDSTDEGSPPTPRPGTPTGNSLSSTTNTGTTTIGDQQLPRSHHHETHNSKSHHSGTNTSQSHQNGTDTSQSNQKEQSSTLSHQQGGNTSPQSATLNSADQQSLRNLFQGYGVVVHANPLNRDGHINTEVQVQFDEQLQKLQGILGRVTPETMAGHAQQVAIKSLIARNCWSTMLGLIRAMDPTFNTLQGLETVPLSTLAKAVTCYLQERSTDQKY